MGYKETQKLLQTSTSSSGLMGALWKITMFQSSENSTRKLLAVLNKQLFEMFVINQV